MAVRTAAEVQQVLAAEVLLRESGHGRQEVYPLNIVPDEVLVRRRGAQLLRPRLPARRPARDRAAQQQLAVARQLQKELVLLLQIGAD